MLNLIIFRLDDLRLGLPLACVERLVRAVWVERLPAAPEAVLGAIDAGGRVLPVIDLRHSFGLPCRAVEPSDCLVVAHTGRRAVALLADTAEGVLECDEGDVVPAECIVPGIERVTGALRLADGLVLIENLGALLSLDDERALDGALGRA